MSKGRGFCGSRRAVALEPLALRSVFFKLFIIDLFEEYLCPGNASAAAQCLFALVPRDLPHSGQMRRPGWIAPPKAHLRRKLHFETSSNYLSHPDATGDY